MWGDENKNEEKWAEGAASGIMCFFLVCLLFVGLVVAGALLMFFF